MSWVKPSQEYNLIAPLDAGNSDDPCSNVYRGYIPASEPETRNVQTEVLRIAGIQTMESFVTTHTAARMILTPWGSVLDPGTEAMCERTPEYEEVVSMEDEFILITI